MTLVFRIILAAFQLKLFDMLFSLAILLANYDKCLKCMTGYASMTFWWCRFCFLYTTNVISSLVLSIYFTSISYIGCRQIGVAVGAMFAPRPSSQRCALLHLLRQHWEVRGLLVEAVGWAQWHSASLAGSIRWRRYFLFVTRVGGWPNNIFFSFSSQRRQELGRCKTTDETDFNS